MKRSFEFMLIMLLGLFMFPGWGQADLIGVKGYKLVAPADTKGGCSYRSESVTIPSGKYIFYFASQYKAGAAVLSSQTELNKFIACQAYSAPVVFDNNTGYNSTTLSAGTYYVAVRNQTSGVNYISMEFEKYPPDVSGATIEDTYISSVESYKPGEGGTHTFSVQSGFKYVIEGLNSGGMDIFVIPSGSVSAWRDKQKFSFFYDWSNDPNQPGLETINLSPGSYALVYRNNSQEPQTILYMVYVYRINATGSGDQTNTNTNTVINNPTTSGKLDLSGATGISMSGDKVQITVGRITNTTGSTTGSLNVIARVTTNSDVTSNGYTLGEFSLSGLQNSQYYEGISRTVTAENVPAGTYYAHIVLTEDPQSSTIADSITLNTKLTISSSPSSSTPSSSTPSGSTSSGSTSSGSTSSGSSQSQDSGGGGGSMDPVTLLLFLGVALVGRRLRITSRT